MKKGWWIWRRVRRGWKGNKRLEEVEVRLRGLGHLDSVGLRL